MGMREFNSLVYAIWISSFCMCICVNLMKIFCLKENFIQQLKKKKKIDSYRRSLNEHKKASIRSFQNKQNKIKIGLIKEWLKI